MTEESGRSTDTMTPADGAPPTTPPGIESDGGNGGDDTRSGAGGWSDRLLGLLCLIIGLWYTFEARSFETTAFGSGPVGPKTMPTGVGLMFMAIAAYLVARPDPSPGWPSRRAGWQIALVLACSYLYGQLIEPVGFIVASAAMIVILGTLFRAPVRFLAPAAIGFPVVLAFVFNNLLELQLPDGWWGGF